MKPRGILLARNKAPLETLVLPCSLLQRGDVLEIRSSESMGYGFGVNAQRNDKPDSGLLRTRLGAEKAISRKISVDQVSAGHFPKPGLKKTRSVFCNTLERKKRGADAPLFSW